MNKDTFTTSQAAKRLGVAPSTLRYWETELGNQLVIDRDENGYRQYSQQDLKKLETIKDFLYQQNYSIKQVREILNLEESNQNIAAALVGNTDENIGSLVSHLISKMDNIENGIEDLHQGQENLKAEYLQAIKLLNITSERRDRELIKEIRKRLTDKQNEQHKGFIHRLLPWTGE